MMGTEKLNRHFVGTALVSVLLSLLLALTPVLAVAEPANGGSASADASTIASASTNLVTVPATQTSTGATSLRAEVSYDSNFVKGSATRFTFHISDNTKPLLYKINAFEIQTASGWSSLVDTSGGELFKFTDKSYFEEEIYTSGDYRLSFYVAEYTDNGDGTKTLEPYVRFEIAFTVAESASLKSMDTIIDEVVGQCNSECARQGDTSDYAKALWLNDWVVDNTEYDYSLTYMSAEGVFGRGLGTCEAYHDAYVRLLNKVGIETRRVDSSGDTHVWTGVKLDGKWYNVDTTWNDPGYTDSIVDLKHLYFALPTGVMKLVHTQWDGTYSLGYPNRAAFDAESYEDNYFIRSGEISKFTKPYLEASGTYSVQTHLNARETSFILPVANNSYTNVIYNLVAYQLGRENWGSGVGVTATYASGNLKFQATYLTPISGASISGIGTVYYTGKALAPKPTVKVGTTTLREGTDYTLSYKNNVNVGTASVIVTGKGNYTGTITKTFAIAKRSISGATVSVANQTYTGKALTPKPTVKVGATTLREGTDYSLSYANNVSAGVDRASVTVTGKGNYAGTATKKFTIAQRPVSAATVTVAAQTYTGKALTPKPTVKVGSTTLREGTDYTLSYGGNVNVGTGSVTVVGKGNYTGSRKATFRIEPKPGASTGGGSGSSTAPSGAAMYRLYNPNSGEHFYTASAHERDSLRRAGWKYEGVGWTAPATSRTPVYRLYSGTDHHYTTSAAERDMLVRAGWRYEGVGWYSDDAKGTPLYRQFNPNVNPAAPRNNSGSHNYTTSRAEHDHLVSAGWRGEGIGWYGM